MADNFQTESVSVAGKSFASDEVVAGPTGGTVDYPLTKLALGALNTAVLVEDVAGARIPVKVGEGLSAASVVAGQISLSGVMVALTTVAARRFRLKAATDNTDTIYLGPTGVTTANGFGLLPGDLLEVEVSNLNVIFAIVGSGTQKLHYLGLV
jgi:hypothetical protein